MVRHGTVPLWASQDETLASLYGAAGLKGDARCAGDQALRSAWPGARVFETAQGSEPCTAPENPWFVCQRQRHVGDGSVEPENAMWASHSRQTDMGSRRGFPKSETDMYGTAPYRAYGDGVIRNVDASNALMRMQHNQHLCAKRVTELDWGALFLDYQDQPNRTEGYQRAGQPTRGSAQYMGIIPNLKFAR